MVSLTEMRVLASDGVTSDGGATYNVALNLLKKVQLPQLKSIADIGAGKGNFTKLIRLKLQFLQVIAVDYTSCPAGLHLEDCDWRQADLNQELPVLSNSVDIVCALGVIEYMENPLHLIKHLYRVLKPGGLVIISTPNNHSIRSKASFVIRGYFPYFDPRTCLGHISPILKNDIQRILNEVGFSEVEFHYNNSGSLPGATRLKWQVLLPLLKGSHFSDNLVVMACKGNKE